MLHISSSVTDAHCLLRQRPCVYQARATTGRRGLSLATLSVPHTPLPEPMRAETLTEAGLGSLCAPSRAREGDGGEGEGGRGRPRGPSGDASWKGICHKVKAEEQGKSNARREKPVQGEAWHSPFRRLTHSLSHCCICKPHRLPPTPDVFKSSIFYEFHFLWERPLSMGSQDGWEAERWPPRTSPLPSPAAPASSETRSLSFLSMLLLPISFL